MSVGKSWLLYGLVVRRTGSPPSEARMLNKPGWSPKKAQRIRLPSCDHTPQSIPDDDAPGGFGGTSWLKSEPSGFTIVIKSLVPSGDHTEPLRLGRRQQTPRYLVRSWSASAATD